MKQQLYLKNEILKNYLQIIIFLNFLKNFKSFNYVPEKPNDIILS